MSEASEEFGRVLDFQWNKLHAASTCRSRRSSGCSGNRVTVDQAVDAVVDEFYGDTPAGEARRLQEGL